MVVKWWSDKWGWRFSGGGGGGLVAVAREI